LKVRGKGNTPIGVYCRRVGRKTGRRKPKPRPVNKKGKTYAGNDEANDPHGAPIGTVKGKRKK